MNFPYIKLSPGAHDAGLLILRLFMGFCMIYGHGWGKLMRLFGPDEITFADPFGLGPAFFVGFGGFCGGALCPAGDVGPLYPAGCNPFDHYNGDRVFCGPSG